MINTVLIVDDDEWILEMMEIFFKQEGVEHVHLFPTGKGLKDKIAEIKPDIVLLDIMLPDIDGVSLLKELKEAYDTRYYMMTAYKGAEKVLQAIKLGAIDVLLKPVNWDYLKKEILVGDGIHTEQ